MAKLKVQGNASGTGVVTLTAPNTNTDRTITLPDGDISLGVGIDDNATSTAITINASEDVDFSQNLYIGSAKNTYHKANPTQTDSRYWKIRNDDAVYGDLGFTVSTDNTGSTYTMALELMSDGRGLSQFTAKVWVNVNQSGTQAIRDSHNVSSITDVATGDTVVNFANALANSHYFPATGNHKVGNWDEQVQYTDQYTTSIKLQNHIGDSTAIDTTSIGCVIFGD